MELEEKIFRLLEFYTVEDLYKFHRFVKKMDFDEEDSYEFLDKNTREDYKEIRLEPDINVYMVFLEYRNR